MTVDDVAPDVPEGHTAYAVVDVPLEAGLPIFGRRLFRTESTLRLTVRVDALADGGANLEVVGAGL